MSRLSIPDVKYTCRIVAEKKQAELLAKLEVTQNAHSEEISEFKEQLDSQRQLVATLDQKVHIHVHARTELCSIYCLTVCLYLH